MKRYIISWLAVMLLMISATTATARELNIAGPWILDYPQGKGMLILTMMGDTYTGELTIPRPKSGGSFVFRVNMLTLGVGKAAVRVQNLGANRIPSPRVAVVLLDPLGNQISSAWGRPNGPYLLARSVGKVELTLRTRLIPSGVRVMLLDETCGTCGK